jgi:hypothetical protein
MKVYWGVEVWLHEFFNSPLDEGEWSASRPGHFSSRERAPDTHWIGGWVGLRAGLDTVVKRKIPSPCRDSNPYHPARSPVLCMIGKNINVIKKTTGALLDASDILEVNKHRENLSTWLCLVNRMKANIVMQKQIINESRMWQSSSIRERQKQSFFFFAFTKNKSRLNSGNTWYHSVHILLSYSLLSKNLKY